MPVSIQGQVNLTALVVPDVYVVVVPPAAQNLNGVPTNVLGIVGTASWGPVNSPVTAGTLAQANGIFGPIQPRKYDLLTQVATASQQGANNFKLVRVTDGSDVAASITVLSNCITFSGRYTGSFGNNVQVTLAAGSQATSFKVTVSAPGLVPETFDNIGAGLSGNALWVAIANAINSGTSVVRGPSGIIVAAALSGTSAPVLQSFTLSGGTDGVVSISGATLVGQDTTPRQGMYALRGTGTSVALLADCDDSTTWASQLAYGLGEGTYMVATGPAGDNIANASAVKASAGIDSFAIKILFGDWVYWLDTYNNITRVVSPQGFVAGLLANLDPSQSSLNKELLGVVGTQKSFLHQQYSFADLQNLITSGIDVIANPSPGGSYFSCQSGHNSSSNPLTNGDAYTRMTNYIASTLASGMGQFVGQLQSSTVRQEALATIGHYFDGLQTAGLIGDPNNPNTPAYSIELDAGNNPPSQVALGYMKATIQVEYLAVIEKLILSVQGGASVQIQRQTTTPSA